MGIIHLYACIRLLSKNKTDKQMEGAGVNVSRVPYQFTYRKSRWMTFYFFQGIARTQSPTTRNYAPESPTFGVIAKVSQTGVQW